MADAGISQNVWRTAGRLAGVGIAKTLFPENPEAAAVLGALGEELGPKVVNDVVPAVRDLVDKYGMLTTYDILRIAWEMLQTGDVTPDHFSRLLPKAARQALGSATARGSRRQASGRDESASVRCPESGDTITLDAGPGEYTCPDCDADIVVDDGEATHAIEVECPVADEAFWAGPKDGAYACPCCDLEVTVEAGEADHDAVPEVQCPASGDTIQLEGDGTYSCPDCGEDIQVEDGVASHARAVGPSERGSRRRSVRKEA